MNKNKANIIIIILLVSVAFVKTNAQDPHFSQYFTSPMTINPSFTGKGVADWRISLNARSQWWGSYINPYNTSTIAVEKRIATEKSGNDQIAVGLVFLNDASNNGVLKNNYFGLSAAFNKQIAANASLGVGLSVHYANRVLDPSLFQFQTQFGSLGFQRIQPANDYIVIQKREYVDFNAGANYTVDNDNWGYALGVGYFHAGKPTEGVYNANQYSLDPRLSLQGSAWFAVGSGFSKSKLHISSLSEFQGGDNVYTIGAVYKAKLFEDETIQSINLGLFKRFNDAIYPYIGVEATNWIIGASYDAVTGNVKNDYNSVASFELSFVWQLKGKKVKTTPITNIFNY